jgi:hypothetical protein
MTPHKFKGNTALCLQCFRKKEDPSANHLLSNELESRVMPMAINLDKPKQVFHTHSCPNCSCNWSHEECDLPKTILCENCKVIPSFVLNDIVTQDLPRPLLQLQKLCAGHICSSCSRNWEHTKEECAGKQCKSGRKSGQCKDCAGQTVVIGNRANEIDQIAQTSGEVVTGKERVEAQLDGEIRLFNLLHNQDGKILDNFLEIAHVHFRSLRQMQEKLKCLEIGGRKRLMEIQTEEFSKLTPEEQEQYERDAKKKGKREKEKEKENGKPGATTLGTDKNAAYNKMMKDIANSVRSKKPNLSQDEVLKEAEKRYKRMIEDDDICQ